MAYLTVIPDCIHILFMCEAKVTTYNVGNKKSYFLNDLSLLVSYTADSNWVHLLELEFRFVFSHTTIILLLWY